VLGDVCWDLGKSRRLQEVLWTILKELEVRNSRRYYQQNQDCWFIEIQHLKIRRRPYLIEGVCPKNERRPKRYLLYYWRKQTSCCLISFPWSFEKERNWSSLLGWPYWWIYGSTIEGIRYQETQVLHKGRTWLGWDWGREETLGRRESQIWIIVQVDEGCFGRQSWESCSFQQNWWVTLCIGYWRAWMDC